MHLAPRTALLFQRYKESVEKVLGHKLYFQDDGTRVILGTAIVAEPASQVPSPVPITHYYDLDKICIDCQCRFIFYAEEQKYWYEELKFTSASDCVRCVACRKKQQAIAHHRKRFEQLSHVPERTIAENLEMAECCLSLMEVAVFHASQNQRVRMLLNLVPEAQQSNQEVTELRTRLLALEKRANSR